VSNKQNKPFALTILQGNRIYDAMRSGTLQGFDSFQLEGCLAQFSTLQAQCERIKHTPIPRQYTFFTRMFVWFFIITIPISLVETFNTVSQTWVSGL
jgi:putative membrane protein